MRKKSAQSIMRRSPVFPTSNRIKRSKTCCREPIKVMSGSVSIQIRKSRLEMVHKMRPSIRGRQAAVRASVVGTRRTIRIWRRSVAQVAIARCTKEFTAEKCIVNCLERGTGEGRNRGHRDPHGKGLSAFPNERASAKAMQRLWRPILQS